MSSETIAIVGAGLAGARTAEALRLQGFSGRIRLIGAEPAPPYLRPPLSKDYLRRRWERDKIDVLPPRWYADHRVQLQTRTRVTGIDRDRHELRCGFGAGPIRYDRLVLATGAAARTLQVPGADRHRVFYLRRIEDCLQLQFMWTTGLRRIIIVGAGWIGLEVAAAARQAGLQVTVLEAAEVPLQSTMGREAGQVFADLHRAHGVDVRLGVRVAAVTGSNPRWANGVRLQDGTEIEADLVLAAVGDVPCDGLAAGAGLAVDDGIRVDQRLQTTDPDIYAAGDVANAYHPVLRQHLRVAHWATAQQQPPVLAGVLLGGDMVYDRRPFFYSDQYAMGLEYYGHVSPEGYDEVVFRRDRGTAIIFWLKNRRVLAAMNIDIWDQTDPLRALVDTSATVATDRLADPAVPLTDLLPPRRSGTMPGSAD